MEKGKPEIGIITFWNAQDNYGQLLQCYALQQVLKQFGCDPFLIKYKAKMSKTQRIFHVLSLLFRFQLQRIVKYIVIRIKEHRIQSVKPIDRGFNKFRETYIKSTEIIYSLAELKKNPPQADYYVCGSDQIWNNYSKAYFLDWGDRKVPRIAYAASFGKINASDKFTSKISKALKNFQVVTVREQSGIDICKQAGYLNALCVPDPTLLLTVKDYEKLIVETETTSIHREYLLVYVLGWDTMVNIEEIECFAKQKELEIIYVPGIGGNLIGHNNELTKTFPSLPEWLSLIANAKYVLTNSFHGMVFSIIFNRLFGVYILNGAASRMNDRIYTLLDSIELRSRIYTGDLQIMDNSIDYERVNAVLNAQRDKIKNHFKDWFHL
jgi:transcriptional antiterminator Rof (Rho-off)